MREWGIAPRVLNIHGWVFRKAVVHASVTHAFASHTSVTLAYHETKCSRLPAGHRTSRRTGNSRAAQTGPADESAQAAHTAARQTRAAVVLRSFHPHPQFV